MCLRMYLRGHDAVPRARGLQVNSSRLDCAAVRKSRRGRVPYREETRGPVGFN